MNAAELLERATSAGVEIFLAGDRVQEYDALVAENAELRETVRTLEDRLARKTSKPKIATTRCTVCGQGFKPSRSDARYCSSGCRQRSYRERAREKRHA